MINILFDYRGKVYPNFTQILKNMALALSMTYECSESHKYLLYVIICSLCCMSKGVCILLPHLVRKTSSYMAPDTQINFSEIMHKDYLDFIISMTNLCLIYF